MTAAEKDAIMGRITGTTDMAAAVKNADFVIESAVEVLDIKKEIFKVLDANAPAETILASNSSQLNITDMASVTKRPDKVLGMHFANPVGVMKLVEVVRGTLTSDEAVELTSALAEKLGKEPIKCKDFSFGFIAKNSQLSTSRTKNFLRF
jgi:3-hydroxybutyryl-CoA dehydrogenase